MAFLLSPLDAELAQVISGALSRPSCKVREFVIVDPCCEKVATRVSMLLSPRLDKVTIWNLSNTQGSQDPSTAAGRGGPPSQAVQPDRKTTGALLKWVLGGGGLGRQPQACRLWCARPIRYLLSLASSLFGVVLWELSAMESA